MIMSLREQEFDFSISSECSCHRFDEETRDFVPSPECYGDCVDDLRYLWREIIIQEIWHLYQTRFWQIEGFPVWDGTRSGVIDAKDEMDLLYGMTPRATEWTLRGFVDARKGEIRAMLSHHDCPTGGWMTIRPMIKVDDDE